MKQFILDKWGDMIGLLFVVGGSAIVVWGFREDPKMLAAYGMGLANAGYVALKLRTTAAPNGPPSGGAPSN